MPPSPGPPVSSHSHSSLVPTTDLCQSVAEGQHLCLFGFTHSSVQVRSLCPLFCCIFYSLLGLKLRAKSHPVLPPLRNTCDIEKKWNLTDLLSLEVYFHYLLAGQVTRTQKTSFPEYISVHGYSCRTPNGWLMAGFSLSPHLSVTVHVSDFFRNGVVLIDGCGPEASQRFKGRIKN